MATLIAVMQLLPLIVQAVQSIEQAAPVPGAGPDKKALILDVVTAVLGDNGIVPSVAKVVDLVVALLNKLGVFKQVPK